MAIGDLIVLEQASMTGRGARTYKVAAGATTINPGEPVIFGNRTTVTVTAMPNNNPVANSDYFVGIAATTSTQTSGTAGYVGVYPIDSNTTYLIKPKVAATWDTQAEYDALVNSSVLIDLTSGSYTLLASDSTNNGVKVMPMSITEHPGMIAISFRDSTSYLR